MKKIFLSLITIVFAVNFSHAQWTTSGSNIYNSNAGNVGIGTTSPQTKLHLYQITPDATGLIIQGNIFNVDAAQHYIAVTLDGDYGNETGNYSQIRSYSNLYARWGSQLAFFTTQTGVANTLTERMRIDYYGNVGIGTTTPSTLLHLYNAGRNSTITMERPDNTFETGTVFRTTAAQQFYLGTRAVDGANNFHIYSYQKTGGGADVLNIDKEGNVGIGTTTPDQLLSVNGNIHAQEVLVNLTGFEDRVFKPTYHLPSLTKVETYINKNHHLPDVPSEAEVLKNGLKLGDMDRLLTKKVEELTLYLIEKDKQLAAQQQQIDALSAKLDAVQKVKTPGKKKIH